MKTGTKTKTAKTKTNRTNQACTEVGEGHEGKGGEEKSASWDLCHKKGRQAEKQRLIMSQGCYLSMLVIITMKGCNSDVPVW